MGRVLILGIETSCDETSAAVVADGKEILSNQVASQIELHRRYGGVFPEVASRQHVLSIVPVLRAALSEAGVGWEDIDAVAVTYGPGLAGSLLVGVNAAKGIAWSLGLPLVGVNHLEGHIYSSWLNVPGQPERAHRFPFLALLVSGGHTELILVEDHLRYRRLGGTIDDAAGEAFDKVARVLGLGYPGGPAIQKAAEGGDPKAYRFPRAWLHDTYDFSFSGLKTAVLRQVQKLEAEAGAEDGGEARRLTSTDVKVLSHRVVADLAASFQEAVVDVLVEKTRRAALEMGVDHVCVCGGVSANKALRKAMAERMPVPVFMPPLSLCTDNAAMIAAAGYWRFVDGDIAGLDLDVVANLPLVGNE